MTASQDNTAFIFQGPVVDSTFNNILNVRSLFPKSRIILSTWKKDQDKTKKLCNICDEIVLNEDPGSLNNGRNDCNLNRQIVSTIGGIAKAEKDYVIKLRTDCTIKSNKIFKNYNRYNKANTITTSGSRILIVTFTTYRPKELPYHPCDWFLMGKTEEIFEYFSCNLINSSFHEFYKIEKKPTYYKDPLRYCTFDPESYLLVSYLTKRGIKVFAENMWDANPQAIVHSNNLYKDLFIVYEFQEIGLITARDNTTFDYNQYSSVYWYKSIKIMPSFLSLYVFCYKWFCLKYAIEIRNISSLKFITLLERSFKNITI